MMKQQHVLNQIPDYVLGLLPSQERQQVEQHAAVCVNCRQVLHQEREIGQAVYTTLGILAQPSMAQLRQLMPPPPQRRSFLWRWQWQKQVTLAALLLTLLLGGIGLYQGQQPEYNPSLAATATLTNAPTMTIATHDDQIDISPEHTEVPNAALYPILEATPTPLPTPVASLNRSLLNGHQPHVSYSPSPVN